MKTTTKRFALLVAAVMLMSVIAVPSFAEGAKWTETDTGDGWFLVTNEGGTTLGYSKLSGKALLEVDGYAFKDLNGNGALDTYEDWRLTPEERAKGLVDLMSGEEIAPYLSHGGWGTFSEDRDMFRSEETNANGMKFIKAGGRGGVTRNMGNTQESNISHAKWVNLIQELCEELPYGLPAMISIDPNGQSGIVQTLSLAATFDPALALEVGKSYSKQYRAAGVSMMLGPQVDVATSPLMQRGSGTYGEDPALDRDIAEGFVSGMQSTFAEDGTDLGWGPDSVMTIMKHWVGAGAQEGGRDDHSSEFAVYPGHNFEAQLIPFVDGAFNLKHSITGKAGGIMTNYSVNTDLNNKLAYEGEQYYGGAFAAYKYDLLKQIGWDGYIISDWGPLSGGNGAWGWKEYTNGERVARAISLGMNQMGGFGDMDAMQEGWEILCDDYGEEKALELMRACAYKNAVACMRLGLFDNPYCSIQHVIETNWTEETIAYGIETQLKAMVMLKNNGLIKDNTASEEKLTVYMPASFTAGGMVSGWRGPSYQKAKAEFGFSVPELEKYFNVITDTIGEPTGKAPDDTEEYQLSDITAPSAEELANVDFILMPMNGPYTASSVDDKYDAEADEEYGMYTAPNLQYHGRTASGARNPSIGGEMQTITFNDGYEMQTSIRKANLSYWNKTVADATTITQLQKLEELKAMGLAAPIVVVMKANNSGAMCWHEVEPLADVIFYRYGSVSDTAAAQILAGKVEPSALLVQQQPISMEVVDKDQEDVPRDLECYVDAAGNAYDFAFGLNWSGKIEDERVTTYTAAPLTKVENMEFKYADAM